MSDYKLAEEIAMNDTKNNAAVKPIGTRELHYLENKLSGMVVTESANGAIVVPIVDVRDGAHYRARARQIEKLANGPVSKYFSNNDRLKFPRSATQRTV